MKKIICLLSILSLLLCACSPNNNDSSVSNTGSISDSSVSSSNDVASQDSETSSESSVIEDSQEDPVYLPLSYMYAINLDTGSKVTPCMTREEVEKTFLYNSLKKVKIYDDYDEPIVWYEYGGLDFGYNENETLLIIKEDLTYKDNDKYNYQIAGIKDTEIHTKSYKDILKIFGTPTKSFSYDNNYYPDIIEYYCYIEKDELRVLTPKEYEKLTNMFRADLMDEYVNKCVNIEFRLKGNWVQEIILSGGVYPFLHFSAGVFINDKN